MKNQVLSLISCQILTCLGALSAFFSVKGFAQEERWIRITRSDCGQIVDLYEDNRIRHGEVEKCTFTGPNRAAATCTTYFTVTNDVTACVNKYIECVRSWEDSGTLNFCSLDGGAWVSTRPSTYR